MQGAGRLRMERDFQTLGARVAEVRRAELAEVGERAAEYHNLVFEAVVEIRGVEDSARAEKPLLGAGVKTDAALGFQPGVVRESEFEAVRRPNPRAEARVQARGAPSRSVRLAQHISERNTRVHLRHGACRKERPLAEGIRRKRSSSDAVRADSRDDEEARGGVPAVFREIRPGGSRQQKRRAAGVGDERVADLLAVPFQASHQKVLRRKRDLALFIHGAALVVRERIAKGRNEVVVVGRQRPRDDLAEARRKLLRIMPAVAKKVLLVARYGVEAGEKMIRVGAV